MNVTDETLMAYADGELDAAERREVDSALAADPELARRLAAHGALRSRLSAAFVPVLTESVPERLTASLHTPSQVQLGRVLPFRRRAEPARPWVKWGSLAASFTLGALVWQFGTQLYPSGPVTSRNGEPVAGGSLERALNGQLASDQPGRTPVRIGVSFLSKRGEYCRTFQMRDDSGTSGLACRHETNWNLEVLSRGSPGSPDAQHYRQAASSLPPAVLEAVNEVIAGEPLDAAAESDARAKRWRAP